MKKKVHMSCVLKSGTVVKDAFRIAESDFAYINALKAGVENALANHKNAPTMFTFGHTSIRCEDIAAVKIW